MNSTLTRRILLPFATVAIVVLAVLATLEGFTWRVEGAHKNELHLLALQVQLREIAAQVQSGILTGEERFAINTANAALAADRQLQALTGRGGERDELAGHFEHYYAGMMALHSLFLENRHEEGSRQLAKLQELQGHIDEQVDRRRQMARTEREDLAELTIVVEMLSILILLGALLLMAALFMRRVVVPLRAMAQAMEEVAGKAEDELAQQSILAPAKPAPPAPPPMRDELASLEHSFRRMLDLLSRERESLHLAASVFGSSHEGILICDPDGSIIDVNDAFCAMTGYTRAELIGRNPRLLKSGRHDAPFYQALWQALTERGFWNGEIWDRRKDGRLYPQLLTINAVRSTAGDVAHYVAVSTDISLIKLHEKELEHMAHFDALTGIPNRVLLADRMAQAIAQTRRERCLLAVGYLDLDEFKPINDQYGHAAGDKLLIEISRRLNVLLRGSDTIARLGGDEFVFLLLDLEDEMQCAATLKRILEAIAQPVDLDANRVAVSASIGVSLYPLDDADPDTLLRHADQAMYQAKQAGRNRFHIYDPEHDRRTLSQREAVLRIDEALAGGELELHYQPKVDMRAGSVIGAEALIRWRHPQGGLLSPQEFLPVVEHSETDLAIGRWVVDTALRQMRAWRSEGFDLPVSVNISAHHLQHDGFADWLAATLAAHPDVPPARLQLEVLENAALGDIVKVSAVMHRCRESGVAFALDDFGTGYSSLTYLRRLPVEVLKIDRSFVGGILSNPEDLLIVQSVIALARAFGHSVVAEGVENGEQGLALLALGCRLAQGYGIAAAMPAAELPAWAATWQADPRWLAG